MSSNTNPSNNGNNSPDCTSGSVRDHSNISPEECRLVVVYTPPKKNRASSPSSSSPVSSNSNPSGGDPNDGDEIGLDPRRNHVSRVPERDAAAAASAGLYAPGVASRVVNPYASSPGTPTTPTAPSRTAAPAASAASASTAVVPVGRVMNLKLYRASASNEIQQQQFDELCNLVETQSAYNLLGTNAMFYNDHKMTAANAEIAEGRSSRAVQATIDGLPTMRAKLADPANNFNKIVTDTGLGRALLNCGVDHIPGIQEFCSLTDSGTIENLNRTGNLLFSAIPCNALNEPSIYNNSGMNEFLDGNGGTIRSNRQYWWKHVNHFNANCNINLAAWIPRFLLTETALADHDRMTPNMHLPNGIGIGGDGEFFKITLWKKYAIVFTKIMEMPLVQAARERGYWPVFLFRQAINQRVKNSMHAHISTTDLNGRSSIMLAGFHRDDTPENAPPFSNLVFISVLGKSLSLLTQVPPRHYLSYRDGGVN